jgi:alkylhydroperoxidase/carboxymuconolactone decarboxylase family protein YurZ
LRPERVHHAFGAIAVAPTTHADSPAIGTALEPRYAELLLVTVLAADYSPWASVHIDGARKAGASETEVAEAVLCAVPIAGLSAWVVGATAMAPKA